MYIFYDQGISNFLSYYPDGIEWICLGSEEKIWFKADGDQLYFDLVGMLVDVSDSSITKGVFEHFDINDSNDEYQVPAGYNFIGKVYVHDPGGGGANASIRVGTTDSYGEWGGGGGA